MGLVNGSIPSLINGISQQPDSLRLPTQAREQVNALSSLIDGLGKRPPTTHVTQLSALTYVKPYVHFINRDEAEHYVVLFYPTSILVVDREGKSYPVEAEPDALSYLDQSYPYRSMKALTISDTTFVLNKRYSTGLTHAKVLPRDPEAVVWVRSGNYKCNYTVQIESTQATIQTDETDVATIATSDIASRLTARLTTVLGTNWTVTRRDNAIWIKPNNGADFKISVTDDNGGKNMSCIKDEVASFSDLPSVAPNEFTVKVRGSPQEQSDDFWVQFSAFKQDTFGPGLWAECIAPNARYEIDASTMPHQLVRKQDTDGSITGTVNAIYFEFSAVRWGYRLCGGGEIPSPSFLGKRINDIFLHRNRLGFLAQSQVVMSQSGNVFNFWRQTATALLDDDPIDISVAHQRAVNFSHAKNFNDELILFSDHTQFTLKGGEILSPKTVSVTVVSEYASHIDCVPVNAESMIYFPFDNGSFTCLREYYVDGQTQKKEAKTVTEHCPRYITGSSLRMTVSPTDDLLFLTTDANRNRLWVYKWFWNGNEKVQSSWSMWEFSEDQTVLAAGFLGDTLYIISTQPDGTFLDSMGLDPGATDDYCSWQTHLDRRVNERTPGVIVSYDEEADQTTIQLPFRKGTHEEWVVTTRATVDVTYVPGRVLTQVTDLNDNFRIVVRGDCTTGFWAGVKYSMEYAFSAPMLRTQSPLGGMDIVSEGRLQVLDFTVKYSRTGYFRTEVTPNYRDTVSYPMTGQVLKAPSILNTGGLGKVQLRDGIHKFAVLSKNDQAVIKIINDSHLPSYFSSAEWKGQFTPKAQRI